MNSAHVEWKTIPEEPTHIWIILTGLGVIDIKQTKAAIKELDSTLDHFEKHYCSNYTFTLMFDLSQCDDYPKMAMLVPITKFMFKHKRLTQNYLRKSYILLKKKGERDFLKNIIFKVMAPTRPYSFEMEDPNLYNAIRYSV